MNQEHEDRGEDGFPRWRNPLIRACMDTDYCAINVLAHHADNTEDYEEHKITPLLMLCQQLGVDDHYVWLLLANGAAATIDLKDAGGDTALMNALICRSKYVVRVLLEHGATVDEETRAYVEKERPEFLELL